MRRATLVPIACGTLLFTILVASSAVAGGGGPPPPPPPPREGGARGPPSRAVSPRPPGRAGPRSGRRASCRGRAGRRVRRLPARAASAGTDLAEREAGRGIGPRAGLVPPWTAEVSPVTPYDRGGDGELSWSVFGTTTKPHSRWRTTPRPSRASRAPSRPSACARPPSGSVPRSR